MSTDAFVHPSTLALVDGAAQLIQLWTAAPDEQSRNRILSVARQEAARHTMLKAAE
ncbi:hypothetical protein [Methylobacterium pseudosasicola]|uniref:hypothetical protein n=1 Tax=Methylobacterium pseudosasicola TaxID=582667 RepID=UPI001428CBDD|nr:hypothetical protein [Methylobacterium pseudosasicola]